MACSSLLKYTAFYFKNLQLIKFLGLVLYDPIMYDLYIIVISVHWEILRVYSYFENSMSYFQFVFGFFFILLCDGISALGDCNKYIFNFKQYGTYLLLTSSKDTIQKIFLWWDFLLPLDFFFLFYVFFPLQLLFYFLPRFPTLALCTSFTTEADNEEGKGEEVSVTAVLVACTQIGKLKSCCLLFFTSRICLWWHDRSTSTQCNELLPPGCRCGNWEDRCCCSVAILSERSLLFITSIVPSKVPLALHPLAAVQKQQGFLSIHIEVVILLCLIQLLGVDKAYFFPVDLELLVNSRGM